MKVFYKDVDKMGIVYYSRYLEFFEAARTEMLSSIGLDYEKVEEKGAMLPVIEAHTEYKKGAVFGQDITVHTTIAELPKVKMKFNYKVTHLNSDEILMTVKEFWTRLAGDRVEDINSKKDQEKFIEISKQMNDYKKIHGFIHKDTRISTTFLKNNPKWLQ